MSNEFDDAVSASLQPDLGQAARVGFSAAAGTNPDAYAEAQRVARRTGVPVDTVLNMPNEMKQQDAMGTIDFGTLAKTSPATATLLADVEKAKIAHDNVGSLSKIENALSFLGGSAKAGFNDVLGVAAKLTDDFNPFTLSDSDAAVLFKNDPAKLQQMREQSPAMFLSRFARDRSEASQQNMQDISPGAQDEYGGLKYATTDPSQAAYLSPVKIIGDAIRSLPTTAALALTTYLTRGAAIQGEKQALAAGMRGEEARQAGIDAATNMATKFGAASEGVIGYAQQAVQTQSQIEGTPLDKLALSPEYQNLVSQGFDPNAARIYLAARGGTQSGIGAGAVDALTNAIGGKFLGKIIGEGGALLPRIGKGFINEGTVESLQSGGEQVFQNMAVKDNADPSQSLSDGVLENMLQGLFVGGLTGGAFSGIFGRAHQMEQKANGAAQTAELLAELNKLAAADKVLQRDPQTFQEWISKAAESGQAQQLFIDANALMQSGVAEQVAAVSPAVAAQLPDALQTGGQIAIPIDEYTARIAPTEYAQSLLDHLKTDPEEFSRAEVQEYMQNHAEELKADVERVLTEKQGDDTFKQSTEMVRAGIKSQLDAAARFIPQVNDAYSAMVGNFYAVQAAKLGVTPEELFQRYPLKIVAERIDGPQFDQGRDGYDAPVGSLLVQHNLTASNLLHAHRMGGIAVPSLAVAHKGKPTTKFGEITLMGSAGMIDPKGGGGAKVFGADIYSPRYPRVTYQVTNEQEKSLLEKLTAGGKATGGPLDLDAFEGKGRAELEESPAVMWHFLRDNGIEPGIVYAPGFNEVEKNALIDAGFSPYFGRKDTGALVNDKEFQELVRRYLTEQYTRIDVPGLIATIDSHFDALVRKSALSMKLVNAEPKVDDYATRSALREQISNGLADEFGNYVSDLFDSIGAKEKIFVGYTNSGNRKYKPHTLETVVAMLKKDLRGGEGFNYGLGNVRAKYTPEFKSVEQIRKNKDRLVTAEDFDKVRGEIDKELTLLADEFEQYHGKGGEFGYLDIFTNTMADAAKMGIPRALRENRFDNVPNEKIDDLRTFIAKLANLPTEYFEAKILRSVPLSEFSGAVVPDNVSPAVLEALKANGVHDLRTYKAGDKVDRQEKIGGFDHLLFQSGTVYNKSKKEKRDDYTLDLFGVPDNSRADTATKRPAAGRPDGELSRNDAPGTYATRTELVKENTRELGTDQVTTPQEAAQAMAYLAKGAVERFDALVTDKDGKPLAIVGAFKGALKHTPVLPSTLAAEAFRVNGAANIWFAHNHPSGSNELSNADRQLHGLLADVFLGSKIKAHGLFAIAGKQGDGRNWVFEPAPENGHKPGPEVRGVSTPPAATTSVPVVERVYTQEERLGPAVFSVDAGKIVAKNLSGGESGVVLLTARNEPVGFVPIDPAEAGELRRDGRMDAIHRALSVSNAGAAIIVNNGTMGDRVVRNLAGLFNSMDARVLDVIDTRGDIAQSWAEQGKGFSGTTFKQGNRGSYNPATLSITLLKKADLSTFLHESGHFFLDMQFDIVAKLQKESEIFGRDTLKLGERQLLDDNDALLRWFGVDSLATWYNLDFEEKRAYHEQFARGFEAYLFEGKSPSIEMQRLFQRFRAWMLWVYKKLDALDVEITDEVRGVFDRMLATNEQITLAEQGRSMMPLFASPGQGGMSPEGFAAYQALDADSTNNAIQDLQARGLRDMRWLHNARGRIIKQLQKEAKAQRDEVQMDVRREVMSQPIYRAWQFLTSKLTADDKITPQGKRTSSPDSIDETRDPLFAAIAKLGGLNRAGVQSEWGVDPKERSAMPVFGKYVLRREGGLPIDAMAELLAQYGYLQTDEHGKWDLHEFEEKFFEELSGNPQYSIAYDYAADMETRAGDHVVNPQALGAGRFDLGELKVMDLPVEVINAVKARRMTAANGLHPDIVAEIFGFTSGDELVRKLAAVEPPRDAIEALTDVRMLEQFGDLTSQDAIEKAADRAIYNDARARFVTTEANALAKATGRPKVLASAAKEYANATIARLKVRNISPGQYASAEVRAAKAAKKASESGDIATAATEKRNQVLLQYATRAAYDALEEVDKSLRYLNRFYGDIKNLDADYAEQISNLLERFDLRKGQSNKAVDKRTALAKWITAQREIGFKPDIPPELENEAFRTSYKNLTVEEFRGLVDTVRQIEHLGQLKHEMLAAAYRRAYEASRDEIASGIHKHANGRKADTRTPTTNMGRTVQGLKRFGAAHIKVATWARIMDGGEDGGPMGVYFILSSNERGDMEIVMRAEASGILSEILAPVFDLGKMGGKGQFFPSINRSLNREARLAIAMNMGNEGNIQRLLGGEGWTMAQLAPVLQSLTALEWKAVQAVWDHLESYRPLIAAKERRIYGKEPDWVQPQPFAVATADGQTVQMRGGYYPIKYDPAASQRAEEHADAESAKRQLQGAYTTATTRRSFTKSRVEEVQGRPLLYTLAGLYSGVNEVIHDLAWHEWLIDTNRLLRSHTIDAAIREHYGPEVKEQFKTWVRDIAEGERGTDAAVDLAVSRLRQGVSASKLGFNIMSALIQPLGVTQSIVRVGVTWVARGVCKYIAHPIDLTRQVNGMSDFMANRARTRFRELNELRNRVQDQSAFKELAGRYAYFLMMRCQQMVDVPTWWGAYEKAIAEERGEPLAIALADQAVIDSQGSGQTKDLAAIERGGPAQKLFTVFYSFMNLPLNLGVGQTMTANTPAKRAKLAVDYIMLYVAPAVLGYFIKAALTPGDSGDDDNLAKLAKRLLAEEIDYMMGLMVVVREFGEAVKTVTGANDLGRDYTGPAGLDLIAGTAKLAGQAHQGEFDDAFRKAAVNVVGDLFGLPSAQINRTITGTKALAEGKTQNPAAIAFGFQEKR